MHWNKLRTLSLASGLLFCQCGEPQLDPSFVPLYAELRVATQELGQTTEDARRMRFKILDKHGYTVERFDSTLQFLETHPDSWRDFQRELVATLEAMESPPSQP